MKRKVVLFLTCIFSLYGLSVTYYVDAARPSDGGDGKSWLTAKKTIQAAIDQTSAGDTVLVTNGNYKSGTTVSPGGSLNNRVVITNAITVRSMNGAAATIIEGSGTNYYGTYAAARCVFITNGILEGFTLRKGATHASGGTLNYSGGGAYLGGATSPAELRNCVVSGNWALYGGGASRGALANCTLSGNNAQYGGATYFSTLANCLLADNVATYHGGGAYRGTLANCTLSGNRADYGGGGYISTLVNCIAYYNTALTASNNYYSATLTHCCSTPLATGAGNTNAEPQFLNRSAGQYWLTSPSPCLNTGTNGGVVGTTDLAGNPRVQNGTVDMGAYEGSYTDAQTVAPPQFSPPSGTSFSNSLSVYVSCATVGSAIRYTLDGSVPTADSALYAGPFLLLYDTTIRARAFRLGWADSAVATALFNAPPANFYVAAARPDDSGDGRNWATAKRTIQAAVNLTADGDTVLVSNGVYNTGSVVTPGGALSNRVVITNAITVRGVNGAAVTIIEGEGSLSMQYSASAIRCVFITNGVLARTVCSMVLPFRRA